MLPHLSHSCSSGRLGVLFVNTCHSFHNTIDNSPAVPIPRHGRRSFSLYVKVSEWYISKAGVNTLQNCTDPATLLFSHCPLHLRMRIITRWLRSLVASPRRLRFIASVKLAQGNHCCIVRRLDFGSALLTRPSGFQQTLQYYYSFFISALILPFSSSHLYKPLAKSAFSMASFLIFCSLYFWYFECFPEYNGNDFNGHALSTGLVGLHYKSFNGGSCEERFRKSRYSTCTRRGVECLAWNGLSRSSNGFSLGI